MYISQMRSVDESSEGWLVQRSRIQNFIPIFAPVVESPVSQYAKTLTYEIWMKEQDCDEGKTRREHSAGYQQRSNVDLIALGFREKVHSAYINTEK